MRRVHLGVQRVDLVGHVLKDLAIGEHPVAVQEEEDGDIRK